MSETFSVMVLVVDQDGQPIPHADLGTRFLKFIKDNDLVSRVASAVTDVRGEATLCFEDEGKPLVLIGYSKQRDLGGFVVIERKNEGQTVTLQLLPTTMVAADYTCKDLGTPPPWTATEMSIEGLAYSCIGFHTKSSRVEFPLPPGKWLVKRYGGDVLRQKGKIETNSEPKLELGEINFQATGLAKLKGKPAPRLSLSEIRWPAATHRPDVAASGLQLSNWAGKWVLLAFWGHW